LLVTVAAAAAEAAFRSVGMHGGIGGGCAWL
jgi:hypothetical protein